MIKLLQKQNGAVFMPHSVVCSDAMCVYTKVSDLMTLQGRHFSLRHCRVGDDKICKFYCSNV